MNAPVTQWCETGIARADSEASLWDNQLVINECIESAYKRIHERATKENKTIIGVNQSILSNAIEDYIIYTIVLVGSVVDSELIKQQQLAQQFDPRNAVKRSLH